MYDLLNRDTEIVFDRIRKIVYYKDTKQEPKSEDMFFDWVFVEVKGG